MADRIQDSGDDQLDRLAARSLAASDRANSAKPAPARRSLLPWLLTTGAIAFALGLVANPWFETSVRSRLPGQFQHPAIAADPEASARVDTLEARVDRLEADKTVGQPLLAAPAAPLPTGMMARLAALEAEAARLAAADAGVAARLDQLAVAASSTIASQGDMKDLFLLSAARRFLQAGRPFGAFERALTQAFSPRDPAATAALVAWSAAPNSRSSLEARLRSPVETLAPPAPEAAGWWGRLVARLSGVVQVRSDPAIGIIGKGEYRKALDALAADDLPRAVAAMELLPQSLPRDLWLADARRLLAAEQGLESLETQLVAASTPRGAALPPVNAPPAAPFVPAQPGPANTL